MEENYLRIIIRSIIFEEKILVLILNDWLINVYLFVLS